VHVNSTQSVGLAHPCGGFSIKVSASLFKSVKRGLKKVANGV